MPWLLMSARTASSASRLPCMSLMIAFKDALLPARLTLGVGRFQLGPVHPIQKRWVPRPPSERVSAAWPGRALAIPSKQSILASTDIYYALGKWPGAQRKWRKLIPQFSLDRAGGSRFEGRMLPQVAV